MFATTTRNSSDYLQFINLASCPNPRAGMSLEPRTAEVKLANEFTLGGRRVILVDTPGLNGTPESDTEVLGVIGGFLAK